MDVREARTLAAQLGSVRAECDALWDEVRPLAREVDRLRRRISAVEAVVDQISEWLGDEGLEDEPWT